MDMALFCAGFLGLWWRTSDSGIGQSYSAVRFLLAIAYLIPRSTYELDCEFTWIYGNDMMLFSACLRLMLICAESARFYQISYLRKVVPLRQSFLLSPWRVLRGSIKQPSIHHLHEYSPLEPLFRSGFRE